MTSWRGAQLKKELGQLYLQLLPSIEITQQNYTIVSEYLKLTHYLKFTEKVFIFICKISIKQNFKRSIIIRKYL
jgi:hypothetical protein